MKRRLLPVFLCLLLLVPLTVPNACAARDVSREQTMAAALKQLSLFAGVSDTDFALDRAPTRVEAVVMLLRLTGEAAKAEGGTWQHPFKDVPDWADKYIGYAYSTGLTSGEESTKFGTGDASAAVYLTFVLRALGYTDRGDGAQFFWDDPFTLARAIGILSSGVSLDPFLRADVVTVSYAALGATLRDASGTLADKLIAAGTFTREQFDLVYRTKELFLGQEPTFPDFSNDLAPIVRAEPAEVEYTIGQSGTYRALSSALDAALNYHRNGGKTVALRLLSDFVLEEQIVFREDYSFCTLTSDADDHTVVIDGACIKKSTIKAPKHDGYAAVSLPCAFAAVDGGVSPLIQCRFKFDRTGGGGYVVGFGAYNGGTFMVSQNSGVTGGNVNLYLLEGGIGYCAGADFSGSYGNGICVFRECRLSFGGGKATDCEIGIYVDGNSVADLNFADFSRSKSQGVYIGGGCTVSAALLKANNCSVGLMVYGGGRYNGDGTSVNDCRTCGMYATTGGEIICNSSSAENCGIAVHAKNGGRIFCYGAGLSGYETAGILCDGGLIYATSCETHTLDVPAKSTDIVCNRGIIVAIGSNGDSNIPSNVFHRTKGLIVR